MNVTDFKIYALNGLGMALNFSSVNLVVIGYTAQKWYLMNKNKKNED